MIRLEVARGDDAKCWGFDERPAIWAAYFEYDSVPLSSNTAILVDDEYWIVLDGSACALDAIISGPFESEEAALTALRIIDAAEGV